MHMHIWHKVLWIFPILILHFRKKSAAVDFNVAIDITVLLSLTSSLEIT